MTCITAYLNLMGFFFFAPRCRRWSLEWHLEALRLLTGHRPKAPPGAEHGGFWGWSLTAILVNLKHFEALKNMWKPRTAMSQIPFVSSLPVAAILYFSHRLVALRRKAWKPLMVCTVHVSKPETGKLTITANVANCFCGIKMLLPLR